MDTDTWQRIGYVIKKHGLQGHIKIYLEEDISKNTKVLFIAQQRRPIPFFIEEMSIVKDIAMVKFEEVDTPETASRLSQQVVYLPKKSMEKPKKTEKDHKKSIIGYRVIHHAKTLGLVKHLNEYALNPLLTVGYADKDILIPLNDYFVRKIDNEQKEITVVLPNGFLTI